MEGLGELKRTSITTFHIPRNSFLNNIIIYIWKDLASCSLGLFRPVSLTEFARGSPRSVLLAFFQSYIEHDLRKNKIVVSFFY
jgi:hypothetical protein